MTERWMTEIFLHATIVVAAQRKYWLAYGRGRAVGEGGGGEGGETISSVTNLVFTAGQEGKVIQTPPHTHTHTLRRRHPHMRTITWPAPVNKLV